MNRFFILAYCCISASCALAQPLNADLAAYQQLQNAEGLLAKKNPNGLAFYQKSAQLYQARQHQAGFATAKAGAATALLQQKKLKESFVELKIAEETAEKATQFPPNAQLRLYFAISEYHFLYKETSLQTEYEDKMSKLLAGSDLDAAFVQHGFFQTAQRYLSKADYQKSFDWLQQLCQWEENNLEKGVDRLQLAENYILMGDLKDKLQLPDEAVFFYEKLLNNADFYLSRNPQRAGGLAMRLGRYWLKRKDYEKAENYIKQSLTYELPAIERAEADRMLAGIVLERNQINEAFVLLGDAMENAVLKDQSSPNERFNSCLQFSRLATQAPAHEQIAGYYQHLFKNTEPVSFVQSKQLQPIQHPFLPELDNNLNAIFSTLQLAEKTIAQLPSSAQKIAGVDWLIAQGLLFFKAKDFARAKLSFETALGIMKQIYPSKHPSVAEVKRYLGEVYAEEKLFENALEAIQAALDAASSEQLGFSQPLDVSKIKFPLEFLYALGVQGQILREMQQGNYTEANLMRSYHCFERFAELLVHIRKTHLNQGSKYQLRQLSSQFCAQAALTSYELGRISKNSQFIARSFYFSELHRSGLLLEATQNLRARKIAKVEPQLIASDDSLRAKMAFLQSEILSELSKGAANSSLLLGLDSNLQATQRAHEGLIAQIGKTNRKYFDLKYNQQTASIEQVQNQLPADGLFLSYQLLSDSSLLVFAISKQKYSVWLQNSPVSIQKDCQRLIDGITSKNDKQYQQQALSLYRLLIAPLAAELEGKRLLYICRDGWLNFIPFEVLLPTAPTESGDYKSYPFLLKQHPIAYQPSASLWTLPRLETAERGQRLQLFAPEFSQDSNSLQSQTLRAEFGFWKLAALQGAQEEVQLLAKLFGVQSYLGAAASESALRSVWKQSAVLHLATHGILHDKNPLQSSLVLGADSLNEGILHTYEIYSEEINAELVVLSACNTGLGELQGGEGALGLARAFEVAGCRSSLMSLWAVSDQATAALMDLFYQYLKQGKGKAEALQLAKIQMLEQYNGPVTAPFYWAAFTLSGDNEPIAELQARNYWWWLLLLPAGWLGWRWRRAKIAALLVIGSALAAQAQEEGQDSVTITVLNSYTQQPVSAARVELQRLHFYRNVYYKESEHSTDSLGRLRLGWDFNEKYQLAVSATDYFPQHLKPSPAHFYQNQLLVSLRPNNLAVVNGQLQLPKGVKFLPDDASLWITELGSGNRQQVAVDLFGGFVFYGELGKQYGLEFEASGFQKSQDTVDISRPQVDFALNGQDSSKQIVNSSVELSLQTDLQLQPSPKASQWVENGRVSNQILFENNDLKTTRLETRSFGELDTLVERLKSQPTMRVAIKVIADSPKSPRQNWLLAKKRAKIINDYLQSKQIDPNRYELSPAYEQLSGKNQELQITVLSE